MFHKLNTISTPWEAVMLMDHRETGAPTATYKPPEHPSSYMERYQVHTHEWKYAASTDLCTDPVTTCTPCNVNVSRVSCVTIYGWTPSVIAKTYFSRGATNVVEYLSGRQRHQPEFKDKMFHSNRFLLVSFPSSPTGGAIHQTGVIESFLAFTFILAKYPSSECHTMTHFPGK